MEKREFDFQGRKIPGEEIDVKTEKEEWNIYKLGDGTLMRVKTVIMSVARLDEYDATGNPVYVVNASPVIGMDVNPSLRKTSK